jgi:pimeloyl-ACP methyl ester carboxylesterase
MKLRSVLMATLAACVALQFSDPAQAQQPAMAQPFTQNLIKLFAADGHVIPALVTIPKDGINTDMPAVVHLHGGPGAAPLAGSGRWIAERLAARGYMTVAPQLSHSKHSLTYTFELTDTEVEAAVNYLETLGFRDVILMGSSLGSITSTRYLADTQDRRIKANVHFSPTADLNNGVLWRIGDEAFRRKIEEAGRAVSQGKGSETVLDGAVFPSVARTWLDTWGPQSQAVNSQLISEVGVPILLLLDGIDAKMEERSLKFSELLKRNATASPKVDLIFYPGEVNHSFYPAQDQVIVDVVNWLTGLGLGPKPRKEIVVQAINVDQNSGVDRTYAGAMQYSPLAQTKTGPAFVIVHDWNDDAFTGPTEWLARALAKEGFTAMGINNVRGQSELLGSTFKESDAWIKYWVDYLAAQGFAKVVLVGHGYGGSRINHYLLETPDARVTAVAYLGPPPDAAQWLQAAAGARYTRAVAEAQETQRLAAQSKTEQKFIQISVNPPPPAVVSTPKIWLVMEPRAFLANWGPQAPVFSKQLPLVKQPVLLLAGTHDEYIDEAAFRALSSKRRNADVK